MFVGTAPNDAAPGGTFIDGIKPQIGTDWSVQVGRTTWWNAVDCMSKLFSGAKAYAQQQLAMDVTKAVLTVPHTFNARQRKLLKTCADKAGVEPIALINEATSAALHYCFENHRETCTLMVVSVGSAFLNASLIEVHNKVVEVRYSTGEVWLGGTTLDECIERWLKQYTDFTGKSVDELDSCARARLRALCEQAKLKILTSDRLWKNKNWSTSAPLDLAPLGLDSRLDEQPEIKLSGQTYEEITAEAMRQICQCIEDVASVAARDGMKPERVLFVGNGTKAPFIWSTIAKTACKGITPDAENQDYDLYAAGGASIYAAVLTKQLLEWIVWDTLTVPIGMETADGQFKMLVSKDTPVPIVVHYSVEMPESGRLKLKFIQGNEVIDEIVIKDASAGLPRPRKIEAAVHVLADGTVSYSARDLDLGVNLSVDLDAEEPVLVELA
jgi:molecular chaperone DnaK (HSP70)